MTLPELRSEYESRVIGGAILEEVRRACASHTRRYPPAVYARSQAWNRDAVEELVQDVAIERLLGRITKHHWLIIEKTYIPINCSAVIFLSCDDPSI